MKSKDLIKLLKANNCEMVRQGKGSHQTWYSPKTNKKFTVPHPKSELKIGLINSIKKDAGI